MHQTERVQKETRRRRTREEKRKERRAEEERFVERSLARMALLSVQPTQKG